MKRISKRMVSLLLVAVMLLGLTACGGKKEEASAPAAPGATAPVAPGATAPTGPVTINIAISEEPTSFDNVIQTKDTALQVAHNMFETLYDYDETFTAQPILVESDEVSADGLTITLNLRKGVMFHDGTEMLAEDVAASLQRWLDYGVKGKSMAAYVASVETDGDYTVIVKLSDTYSIWKDMFAWYSGCWYVVPKEIAEAAGENAITWEQSIGTGPFKFDAYEEGRCIKMSKFDGYTSPAGDSSASSGKREALVDELCFHFVADATTRLNGLQAGQYDYAFAMSNDYYEVISGTAGVNVVSDAAPAFLGLFLNTQSELFADNYKMREAVATAINMTDVMAAAYGSSELWSTDNTSWYPTGNLYHYENDVPWYNQADPAKAATLAKEAGYNGEEIRMLFNTNYPQFIAALTVVMDNLRAAGFNVVEDRMDNTSLQSKRSDPTQWEIFTTHAFYLAVPTNHNPFNKAYAGWWDTPERAEKIEAFNAAITDQDRASAWQGVMDVVTEQVPYIRLGSFVRFNAASDKLSGVGDYYYAYPFFWNVTKAG